MNHDSFEEELRTRLRTSPEKASAGFTESVLDRLGETRERPWALRPQWAAAAAVVLFAIGAVIGSRIDDAVEVSADRHELMREYQEMQAELEQLRQMADDTSPVLYLGGDETFEVLYDLRDYDKQINSNIQPASLPTDG